MAIITVGGIVSIPGMEGKWVANIDPKSSGPRPAKYANQCEQHPVPVHVSHDVVAAASGVMWYRCSVVHIAAVSLAQAYL